MTPYEHKYTCAVARVYAIDPAIVCEPFDNFQFLLLKLGDSQFEFAYEAKQIWKHGAGDVEAEYNRIGLSAQLPFVCILSRR